MPTAISVLAEACTIFSEEGSEQGNEAFHWYGKGLLEGVRMEGQVFEYAMEGFDLGEAEEPKVEVEEGEVSREEQAEITLYNIYPWDCPCMEPPIAFKPLVQANN